MFRCGKEKGDDQLQLHFKEFDSAEGIEVGFLGIVDPPVPPPPAAAISAAAVIPDGMQAYMTPHYDLPPSFSRQHHLYPVAARASLVGGLQQQHCKELFLQQLAGQVLAARPMHLLHRFHGFFFRQEEEKEAEGEGEATGRKAGFVFSPLLSPPRNGTSSFYSTAAAHHRQPQTAVSSYGIHTYVVMAGIGGFNGPLLRDSSNGRCEPINLSRGGGGGAVASRFDVLQDAVAATRCGYCCRGKEHSLDLHHLVSREASGVPTLLSRLNAKSLLQLLTIQAANWCRKLGSPSAISAAPPLLLTYRIYYSLVAMQNMVFQSTSEVTDLLELWQSTFEADSNRSSIMSSSSNSIQQRTAAADDDCDPFMCVVSDLLTWHFCLTVSKAHLTLRERQLRGAHTCSGRRRKRVYRCSMHYFDVDIDCSSRDLGGSWLQHRFQASGDSMLMVMVPGEGKEEEEAAIRYIRKHRALLNLDFVWAFCGAKGYKSAAREVLLVSACSVPASSSLRGCLDQLFRQGCAPVRLDCLMESMEAIAERSRVVLCALMLHMGSILSSNRQLGVQLLLHLLPYVGPQAARMEIFRSRGPRGERGSCLIVTEGGARDDAVRDSYEAEGGAADPSMTSEDDDDEDDDGAYLNALEAFHEYATGLLHSDRAVVEEAATGSSCCHVSSQLLWLEASLLLANYHRRHHLLHLHQSIVISTGHYRRVLDLLLCSPVSALHHSPAAESTAQLCLQHGFFEGVAAVTGRWLESILGESQCLQEEQQQPSTECDAVSRFEHAIVTIHVLTRKNNHYSDAAVAHHRPLQSMQQVQAMLEAVQRCIPHLLSKLVFDLEAAAAAADPLGGGPGSLHCEEVQQQLVLLLRLCWKVSIIASAAAAAAVEDSCGGRREVGVLVEIALEAIVLANTNTPATRLGDTTLPPSIVRRAFDSIWLAAATRFRAYVVRELLVVGRRGSDGGPHTGCDAAAVIVELLGRSIGAESLLDVIESEPALSRCLDYSMIERLRF